MVILNIFILLAAVIIWGYCGYLYGVIKTNKKWAKKIHDILNKKTCARCHALIDKKDFVEEQAMCIGCVNETQNKYRGQMKMKTKI